MKSNVVYQIECSRCNACYVGQTSRHLNTRLNEHFKNTGPVKKHMLLCKTKINEMNYKILEQTQGGEQQLLTMEALWIKDVNPTLNTKDEFRRRSLTIKL